MGGPRTLALAAAVLAGLAGPALAAPTAATTSEDGAGTATAAAAPDGPLAIVAWDRTPPGDGAQRLEVVERRGGGGWSAPRLLGTGAGEARSATEIALAVNRGGEAALAWRRRAARDQILLATRTAGGVWSPLRAVATGGRLGPPRVAIGPDGTVLVAWSRATGGRRATRVFARVRPPRGALGPRETVALTATSSSPLELDGLALRDGRAVLGWYDLGGAAVAHRSRRGAWRVPPRLTALPRRGAWRVVLAPPGVAFTAWFQPARGGPANANAARGRVLGAVARPGRGWSAAERLSGPGDIIGVERFFLLGIDLAADGAGHAHASWVRYPTLPGNGVRADVGARGAAVAATGSATGWSRGRVLSAPGRDVGGVTVAGSPRAGGLVVWREAVRGEDNDLAFARRSDARGTTWEPPAPLFPPGGFALLDSDAPAPQLGPDRSAAVQLDGPDGSRVALRGAGATAWSLPELVPDGVVTASADTRVVLTADGGAAAVLDAYPPGSFDDARRRVLVVPVAGPGA